MAACVPSIRMSVETSNEKRVSDWCSVQEKSLVAAEHSMSILFDGKGAVS